MSKTLTDIRILALLADQELDYTSLIPILNINMNINKIGRG